MPCTVTGSLAGDQALAAAEESARLRQELDRLTHENDVLREAVLSAAEGKPIKKSLLKQVRDNQVQHRKEDLARLEQTFRASKDATRLGLVMLADPAKPLKPQLGFDPDAF